VIITIVRVMISLTSCH